MTVFVVPARAKGVMSPPLSFRSGARNLVFPDRVKAEMSPPLSFRSEARNLVFPDRVKVEMSPPLSFRSGARNLVVPCGGCSEAGLRSLPAVEMTAGAGRDDSGGRSRRQRG